MTFKPPKVLPIRITTLTKSTPSFDPSTETVWPLQTDRFVVTMSVTSVTHGSTDGDYSGYYTGKDIVPGDWFTTSYDGKALQVESIISATPSVFKCIAKDIDRYNALTNTNQDGDGSIPKSRGLLFEVRNGAPIFGNISMPPSGLAHSTFTQLLSRAFAVGGESGSDGLGGIETQDKVIFGKKQAGGSGGGDGSSKLMKPSNDPDYSSGFFQDWIINETLLADALNAINKRFKDIEILRLSKPTVDNDFNNGLIGGWVVNQTTVSDAVNDINKALNIVAPSKADGLLNKSPYSVNYSGSRDGIHFMVPMSLTNRTGQSYISNVLINRITTDTLHCSYHEVGYNNTGVLLATLNGTVTGSVTLNSLDNTNKNDSGLMIVSDYSYPRNIPSPFKAIDFSYDQSVQNGLNLIEFTSTETGTSSFKFVYDDETSIPSMDSFTLDEDAGYSHMMVYTSGIPHYTSLTRFIFGGILRDWCSKTYLESNIIEYFVTPSIFEPLSKGSFGPGEVGIPDVVVYGYANNTTISGARFGIKDDNGVGEFRLNVKARSPNGDSPTYTLNEKILYLGSNYTRNITEPEFYSNGVTMKRVQPLGSSGRPNVTGIVTNLASINWNSGFANSPGDAFISNEAVIVAGILTATQTDYSTGYLPAGGPDYSSKSTTQYATFCMQAITNGLTLEFDGDEPDYIYIYLPGTQSMFPMSFGTNGWMDAKKSADFPVGTYPGHQLSGGDGCLIEKDGGKFRLTFGTITTKYSTDNMILIRLGLTLGKQIHGIKTSFDDNAAHLISIAGPAPGTYNVGDTLTFTLSFDKPVTVNGTVTMLIDLE